MADQSTLPGMGTPKRTANERTKIIFDGEILEERALAVKFKTCMDTIHEKICWLPLSQIDIHITGFETTISIPRWLVREKGLPDEGYRHG